MKYLKIIIVVLFFSFNYCFIFSQNDESQRKSELSDEILYKILPRIPVNVAHKYIYTEKSKIARELSSGNTQNFERELTYHFTMVAPSPLDNNGFQTVEISVDSIDYKFKNKDTTIYFNDQRDDLRMPKLDDYQIKMVPLGLNFQLTFSPYHDIAKVGGDILIEKRDYITSPNTAPSDEMVKFTWLNGLKDESLITIFDVIKGIPPIEKVAIDSIWSKQIISNVEDGIFVDSVDFKLINFNIQSFTIKGQSKNFKAIPDKVRLFSINQLVDLVDIKGKSDYTIKMHPRGSINQLNIKYNVEEHYKIENDILIQKIETEKNWFLEKMYNW